MRCCPSCSKKIRFIDVLIAVNPARIRCGSCKKLNSVASRGVLIAVLLVSFFAVGLIYFLVAGAYQNLTIISAMLGLGIFAELTYYLLLVKGIISSDYVQEGSSD